MKCVPLEECGGARNYVGHYHIISISDPYVIYLYSCLHTPVSHPSNIQMGGCNARAFHPTTLQRIQTQLLLFALHRSAGPSTSRELGPTAACDCGAVAELRRANAWPARRMIRLAALAAAAAAATAEATAAVAVATAAMAVAATLLPAAALQLLPAFYLNP